MVPLNWLNENSGAVLALLTLVYVVGTVWIARASQVSVEVQRRATAAQQRPRVVAFIENDSERGAAILIIKNVGRSTANELTVDVDPPLLNPTHEDLSFDSSKHLVREGVPCVVPGYEFRSLIGTYGNWDTAPDPSPIIRLRYLSEDGSESFDETFPLDLSPFFDMPASRPKGIHSVVEELTKIRRVTEGLARSLDRLADQSEHAVSDGGDQQAE